MLSHMIKPKNILEVGTYTGYSALCFAEGLLEGGTIDTIDINEELEPMVQRFLEKSGYSDRIKMHVGNALDIIPGLDKMYDIVFIDADKNNYINYYNAAFDKVNQGGYIIADNALWSGKVLDEKELKEDLDTKTIDEYNKMVLADDRVENVLFPIRDGLMIARKK
jgi:predicted O-methyltransferase YrrM